MSSSLGFHTTDKRHVRPIIPVNIHQEPPRSSAGLSQIAPNGVVSRMTSQYFMRFIVLAYVAALPLVYLFMEDWVHEDHLTDGFPNRPTGKAAIIGAAAIVTLAPMLCHRDPYTLVLTFHTAVESFVIYRAVLAATDETNTNRDQIWAWVGAIVVLLHLFPFYLVEDARVLALVSIVGVPVSVAVAAFTTNSIALLVGTSATLLELVIYSHKDGSRLLTGLNLAM